jgi:hypothetical protein
VGTDQNTSEQKWKMNMEQVRYTLFVNKSWHCILIQAEFKEWDLVFLASFYWAHQNSRLPFKCVVSQPWILAKLMISLRTSWMRCPFWEPYRRNLCDNLQILFGLLIQLTSTYVIYVQCFSICPCITSEILCPFNKPMVHSCTSWSLRNIVWNDTKEKNTQLKL